MMRPRIRNNPQAIDIPFEPEKLFKVRKDAYPYMGKTCIAGTKDISTNYDLVPTEYNYIANIRNRKGS